MACNVILVCGESELEKHSQGKKHVSNTKCLRGSNYINMFTQNPKSEEKIKSETDVKRA